MAEPAPPPPSLHRHVEPTRRRPLWWWALAGTAAANAALTLGLGARSSSGGFSVAVSVQAAPPAPAPVVIVQAAPSTAPAAAPAAAPARDAVRHAPFADAGPCPAPHAATPRGALTQPTTEGTLRGVATAPDDSRLVVAWDRDAIHVSRDGGHSWGRVLDGAGEVLDASFDCHGRVLALRRGAGLGMRDGMDETWNPVGEVDLGPAEVDADDASEDEPGGRAARLIGGGRLVAVLGAGERGEGDLRALAAITRDAGETWRRVDLSYFEGADVRGEWTGDTLRLAVPWTDCMVEGVRVVTVAPDGVTADELGAHAAHVALAGAAVLAPPYACDAAGGAPAGGLCAWRDGAWARWPAPVDDDGFEIIDGPVDVLLVGGQAYRVGPRGHSRGRPWPADARALTTDRAGRVWGLDELGVLVRA